MEFEFSKMLEEVLTWIVAHLDGPLWDATIIILLGTGLFFTITTGFVQFRLFPASLREMWFGRSVEGSSLTPFKRLRQVLRAALVWVTLVGLQRQSP